MQTLTLVVAIIFLVLLFIWLAMAMQPSAAVRSTRAVTVDFDKYLGKWNEIYRLPNEFEVGLTNVTAQYGKDANGNIIITNCGTDAEGKQRCGSATAKQVGPNVLDVSFFPGVTDQYIVADVDPAYQRAVVVSKYKKYLWLLARNGDFAGSLDYLTGVALANGYTPQQLATLSNSKVFKQLACQKLDPID